MHISDIKNKKIPLVFKCRKEIIEDFLPIIIASDVWMRKDKINLTICIRKIQNMQNFTKFQTNLSVNILKNEAVDMS